MDNDIKCIKSNNRTFQLLISSMNNLDDLNVISSLISLLRLQKAIKELIRKNYREDKEDKVNLMKPNNRIFQSAVSMLTEELLREDGEEEDENIRFTSLMVAKSLLLKHGIPLAGLLLQVIK